MTGCASTLPPAGSKAQWQAGINLGHPFQNPHDALTGNQKLQQAGDRETLATPLESSLYLYKDNTFFNCPD